MASRNVSDLKALAQKQSLQGKRALAAETYQLLFKEEPSNPRWPQKAGEEYRTVGQKDKAVGAFQIAAKLYAQQGFTLKAITLCKLILDLDKTNQAAQQLLASISASAGTTSAAPPAPTAVQQPGPAATPVSPRPAVTPGPTLEMFELPQLPEQPEFIDMIELQESPGHESVAMPAAAPREFQTIDIPEVSELPKVPELPEMPDMLEVPESLEVPDMPEVRASFEVPEAPVTFEVPEIPEVPGAAETFEVPEVPEAPEVPVTFEVPETPEAPGAAETFEVQEALEVPDTPAASEETETLEVPEAAATFEVPELPEAPEGPEMFEVPEEQETLEAPGRPAIPAVDAGRAVAESTTRRPQPADTLVGSELSRVIPPTVSALKFDVNAFEIVLDDPETSAVAAERPAPSDTIPKDEILTRMPPVPIFSFLSRAALQALMERVEVRTFAPGARLITQGEQGNSLFVLVDGEVSVVREGPPRVELTHLKEGAFFGEIALVTKAPRTATVDAVRESLVLEISRDVFNELVQSHPDMLKVILRHLRERLVNGLVETHPLFAPFAGAERTLLVRRFSLLEAAGGCVLAEEGVHANAMYIILCGEAESRRGNVHQARLTTGDIFGVESLLTGQPSPVSIKTLTRCWILKMREDTFRQVIQTCSPVLATLSDMVANQDRKPPPGPPAGHSSNWGSRSSDLPGPRRSRSAFSVRRRVPGAAGNGDAAGCRVAKKQRRILGIPGGHTRWSTDRNRCFG